METLLIWLAFHNMFSKEWRNENTQSRFCRAIVCTEWSLSVKNYFRRDVKFSKWQAEFVPEKRSLLTVRKKHKNLHSWFCQVSFYCKQEWCGLGAIHNFQHFHCSQRSVLDIPIKNVSELRPVLFFSFLSFFFFFFFFFFLFFGGPQLSQSLLSK